MPSDPEQDADEGRWIEAEEREYWSRRSDPGEVWCRECDKFSEECRCDEADEEDEDE